MIMVLRNLLYLSIAFFFFSCGEQTKEAPYLKVQGKTMGTTYNVTYQYAKSRDFKPALDSLLKDINAGVSTYIPSSVISRFNQSEEGFFALPKELSLLNPEGYSQLPEGHFLSNLVKSSEVYQLSKGAFDPTVMPLVNYWGFGYTPKRKVTDVDSVVIDSLVAFVGLEKLRWNTEKKLGVLKTAKGIQLDFSAIAKGYAVDGLGIFLESKGINNYLAEIGGEVVAKGLNSRGEAWRLGISTPREGAAVEDFQAIVQLKNQGMATSGNYRNYYEVDGQKYSHSINPSTGYPERSNLLSATVIAPDCMTADAWATAFMVMGFEKASKLVNQLSNIEAYFIISDEEGSLIAKPTEGIKSFITEN